MGLGKVRAVQQNVKVGRYPPPRASFRGASKGAAQKRGPTIGSDANPGMTSFFPYSTLPIFFTAAIRRALSSVTNFENSGASR